MPPNSRKKKETPQEGQVRTLKRARAQSWCPFEPFPICVSNFTVGVIGHLLVHLV